MPAPLQISQRAVADVVVLTLNGPLIVDDGDMLFREHVASVVAAGSKHILLDVRDVTHMDSGGAGALAATLLHVTRRGGCLKLLGPSARVCRVLEITHLRSIFDVFEVEDEALRSFDARARAPRS